MTTEKPKIDRTKYMFTDKKNETLIKRYGELEGFNFKMRNLENCKVYILDWTKGMFIDDCVNCEFLISPCDGSIFIRTSKNCSVSVISKQLRFRDCENLKIYAYCVDPVIESSENILFAPFNYAFPNAKELFIKAKFEMNNNKYFNVYDFSEKKNEDKVHFRLMEKGEFEVKYLSLPSELSMEAAENEFFYESYPKEFEGLLSEEASKPVNQEDSIEEEIISNNNVNLNEIDGGESNNKAISMINIDNPELIIKETVADRKNYDLNINDHNSPSPTRNKEINSNRLEDNIDHFNDTKGREVNDDILIANEPNQLYNENYNNNNNQSNDFAEEFISPELKKPFEDFHILEKEDPDKTISSFQNVSYKGSSNENSVGSQPKITLNCHNIEQVENYFLNSNPESNLSPSNVFNFNNFYNNNPKDGLEKIKTEFVFVGEEKNKDENEKRENPLIEHLESERVEIEKRMRKIKKKIEFEFQRKLELKQKAIEYITNFQNERIKSKEANKLRNIEEENLFRSQKLENNKANPWKKVMQNINIKESDYKGSANIARMRECIINRKGDFDRKIKD